MSLALPARPDVTRMVLRGAARLLRSYGCSIVTEMTFASGRRADIVALAPGGEITVIEVKSGLDDYRSDGKWLDYRDYCDRFGFAVAPEFPSAILPEDVGLIIADSFGGAWQRQPPLHALAGARRRALTLAFARLAADRLHGLADPQMQLGGEFGR